MALETIRARRCENMVWVFNNLISLLSPAYSPMSQLFRLA